MEGQKLGKYQVQKELGRGGFATVYEALDTVLHRPVALKILNPQLTSEHNFIERFRVEARLAAGLSHPHIVKIFDFGEHEGRFYLVMELIRGRNLKEVLRQDGALPLHQALDIVAQIGEALDYIHQQNVVHRDVKASNIVVDGRGRATLLDFSIVRSVESTHMTTNTSQLGTPEYMAPEVLNGEEATALSDLYALGIVLYELVTGQLPFTGHTPAVVIKGQVLDAPRPPRELVLTLPKQTNQLILQMLAKEPVKRPPTAGVWVEALQKSAAEKPRPEPKPLPAGLWKWVTAGLGLVGVLMLLGWWLVSGAVNGVVSPITSTFIPSKTPVPTKTQVAISTQAEINILWTNYCDPRTSENYCQISDSLDILEQFYDVVDSLNGTITYKVPYSSQELNNKYDVIIVDFCGGASDTQVVEAIKQYIQNGGSAFIMGDNFCFFGEHYTAWWATQLTEDFGVTFTEDDDVAIQWASFIDNHPITNNVEDIYLFRHAYLEVNEPAEPLIQMEDKPVLAVYDGVGTFIAISGGGFEWAKRGNNEITENIMASDNFLLWRNALEWLAQKSKEKRK